MSKRTTTRWYIDAWVVWLVALVALIALSRGAQAGSSPPAGVTLVYLLMFVAGVVTFVMWLGALIRLAQQRLWGWFAAVVVLQVVALGIVGMVAYALAGPDDSTEVVMRPSVT
jgi:hypothetical protein